MADVPYPRPLTLGDFGPDVEGVGRALCRTGLYVPLKFFMEQDLSWRRTFGRRKVDAVNALRKREGWKQTGVYNLPVKSVLQDAGYFDARAIELIKLWKPPPPPKDVRIRDAISDFCTRAESHEYMWHYCVPTDHRILTEDGYRFIDDIGESRVAVIDHDTREIRFEPPQAISRFPYSGPMVAVQNHGAEILCTPDHSWPVESYGQTQHGRWYPGRRALRKAHELTPHWSIPLTGSFDRGRSILSPRHAAILGWLVTDGTTWRQPRGQLYGTIAQSEGKYLSEIAGVVGREPQAYRSVTRVAKVYIPREDMEIIERVYQSKADLPQIVTRLDRESGEAMWQAMMKAEGDYSSGEGRFAQRPGPVIEAFQILNFLTGRAGFVRGPYANGMKNLYVRARDRLKWNARKIDHWEGEVWCPTTSTGTWIVERDGLLLPTGNSQHRPFGGFGVVPEREKYADCSAYVILSYFWARQETGLPVPDPSGYAYKGWGNTWDDLDSHTRVSAPYEIGDLAHYEGHVSICRKTGTSDTAIFSSFGREAGPERTSLHYRSDLRFCVRPRW